MDTGAQPSTSMDRGSPWNLTDVVGWFTASDAGFGSRLSHFNLTDGYKFRGLEQFLVNDSLECRVSPIRGSFALDASHVRQWGGDRRLSSYA